jgi:16S rRNA (adenine1518-N6/adenine1519-N6)-dimethyltransferase
MSKPKETTKDSPDKFIHKKSLGQNFLTSDLVPKWLCDAASLKTRETVLEIGPGTGRLTTELLARGVKVVAVEADERAITLLRNTFSEAILSGQLSVHSMDARELDLGVLGLGDQHFKVVANIPYYLSGHLLRTLLESNIQPTTLVFLMQKELVARIATDPKESLLSLSVKVFGEPRYVKTVKRGHFYPIPNVDSAILSITNINRAHFTDLSTDHFFSLLHLGLGSKRKQLLGNLSQVYQREEVSQALTDLGLTQTIRGEDVSLPHWIQLANKLQTTN